ncbi:uncharacterized protein N7487_004550 [Penicillium crustosum]|uniref:uncharacterized protein n=1 Tax=Penicillium crustosum TaxID=36656 RepID=UPI00239DDF5E|nr:uncharacterized protein N7487_004550 [Penicillium crustosum]KAJ5410191.1 hypothetical protein N7487_004550 [Penicillium crustosum]
MTGQVFPDISKTQANYRSNAPEVGSEPMLTGVSPMATPAAAACNQSGIPPCNPHNEGYFVLGMFQDGMETWKTYTRNSTRPPAADVLHRSGRGCLIRTMIRDYPMAMW